jgi:tetratricopeptide (TPR) repeat protein
VRRHLLAVVACLALFPGLKTFAQDLDPNFARARDAVYDQNRSPREIDGLLEASRRTIGELTDPQQRLYWLARLESLSGYMDMILTKDNRAAEAPFEESLSLSREALKLGEFSEGYRLMSSDISYLCAVKGVGYAMVNGRDVERHAEEAVRLDPANGKAMIVLASIKIYVPPLFGGDPQKGIEILQKALRLAKLDKEDLFDIYSRIGVAFGKLRNHKKAREYLSRSLQLFPSNLYAKEELDKLS